MQIASESQKSDALPQCQGTFINRKRLPCRQWQLILFSVDVYFLSTDLEALGLEFDDIAMDIDEWEKKVRPAFYYL